MLWPTAESTQPSLFLVKVSPFQGNNFTTMCTFIWQHYSKQVNKGGLEKNYEWVLLVLLTVYFIKWLIIRQSLEAIVILTAFTIEPIFMGAITTVVIHWHVHLWAYFVFKHRYLDLWWPTSTNIYKLHYTYWTHPSSLLSLFYCEFSRCK